VFFNRFKENFSIYLRRKADPGRGEIQIFPSKNRHIPLFSSQTMLAIPREPTNQTRKGENVMSTKNSNKLNVPEARAAMDKFKMEAASEVGVNLKEGYNGDLTSREAGSVGGQMVKKMTTARHMSFQRKSRVSDGHLVTVRYIAGIGI
jgi:small acid-soluble spore protein D (minor alpha/beta-type SASP)